MIWTSRRLRARAHAVPGQNFNALWDQVLIQFNPGVTPHQFTSEADILAAAKAGQITLINTGEVYRDSVVGGSSIPLTNPSSGAAAVSTGSSAQPALPLATQATTNKDSEGAATQIPAFFNGQSVTINVVQLSDKAAASILANNPRLQTIFVTNDLDEPQTFAPCSRRPGQNFNALWDQVLIQFNPGVTPHQFTSEADILAAAKAGQITLINTGEVYRDSVVGGSSHA